MCNKEKRKERTDMRKYRAQEMRTKIKSKTKPANHLVPLREALKNLPLNDKA